MNDDTSAPRPVTLDDIIPHDEALERYPWLSGQILARWRRERMIRHMKGKNGVLLYPKCDLEQAVNKELVWGENESPADSSNTANTGSARSRVDPASTDTTTMSEADAIRERLFLKSISTRKWKPRK